jgi:hypothetical protein
MDDSRLKEWTSDELVAEIRRRERLATGGQERQRASPPCGRSRELADIPTNQLTKLAQERQRVIYGVDNRQELYEVRPKNIRAAADAVVALVRSSDLRSDDNGTYILTTESYQHAYQLCESEPFVLQPTGCFCSGFLVAPDIVATAGHCVKSKQDLENIRFVFGFRMIDSQQARMTFHADDIYAGSKLIGRQLSADGTDWALIRLDRSVRGRKPVPFRTKGKIGNQESVFVIGHPCGLPQKYAPGATVRDNSPAPFFVANLDTYGGNSGSPVFNARNMTVEGILVRGENDFVTNGNCYVSLVCPSTGCRGEDVMRATVWAPKVPKMRSRGGITRGKRASAKRSRN